MRILTLCCLLLLTFTLAHAQDTTSEAQPTTIIIDLAWSPDGTMIIGGGIDGFLRIWDAITGTTIRDLQGVTGTIFTVAWSPDSTKVATGGADTLIRIWDVSTGQLLNTLQGHLATVISVSWSPSGNQIASASFSAYVTETSLRIWDTSTSQQVYGIDIGVLTEVVWNPNSNNPEVAVSNENRFIAVRQITSTELPRRVRFEGNAAQYAIAWSPDSTMLASGDVEGTIYIWDTTSGALITSFSANTDGVRKVAWHPDGTLLAVSSFDGYVRLWDTTTGTIEEAIYTNATYAPAIDWSPDGTELVYVAEDETLTIIEPSALSDD